MRRPATGALNKALSLLHEIASAEARGEAPPIAARLAEITEIDAASVSRLLRQLVELRLLEWDAESRSHQVGAEYFRIADGADRLRLIDLSRPLLRGLAAQFGMPAWLSVRLGSAVLTLAAERDFNITHVAAEAGRVVPAWCSAAGRALLADETDDSIRDVLSETTFLNGGTGAPGDIDELLRRVRAARSTAAVVAVSEFDSNTVETSVPIRGSHGEIVAALSIACPVRASSSRKDLLKDAVVDAGAVVQGRLATRFHDATGAVRSTDRGGP